MVMLMLSTDDSLMMLLLFYFLSFDVFVILKGHHKTQSEMNANHSNHIN